MFSNADAPSLFVSEIWNATTSLINFGNRIEQTSRMEQTNICLCYPLGSGEVSTGTLFSQTPSNSNNGCRMYVGDNTAQPNVVFNAHSSGSNANPSRASAANTAVYNAWNFLVSTWDGGIVATGIKFYGAQGSADVAELSYFSTGVDGSGSALSGSANNFIMGNRGNQDRTYNGIIAYLARWGRVLTLPEIAIVQRRGPLSVSSGLIFCWANLRDYGPYNLPAQTRTSMNLRGPPNVFYPLGITRRRLSAEIIAAGAFNVGWAVNANVVIQSGARAA